MNNRYGAYLDVALLQQRLVAVGGGPGNVGALVLTVGSQTFVKQKTEGFKERVKLLVFPVPNLNSHPSLRKSTT